MLCASEWYFPTVCHLRSATLHPYDLIIISCHSNCTIFLYSYYCCISGTAATSSTLQVHRHRKLRANQRGIQLPSSAISQVSRRLLKTYSKANNAALLSTITATPASPNISPSPQLIVAIVILINFIKY